jgi:transposase
VSQGDHHKVTVEDWVREKHEILEQLTGLPIRKTDFTDDRLTIALRHLSSDECWNAIEENLGRNLIRIYELPQETVQVDATTVSGYHQGGEGSLWQYGQSKDNPALRQIKLMMAALDPLGLPLGLDVVEGKSADDLLYQPVIQHTLGCLCKLGLLIVGDCKMSALLIRAAIEQAGQYYLMPLSLVGDMAKQLDAWVKEGLTKPEMLRPVLICDEEGTHQIARGYEVERTCTDGKQSWQERVLIVQSEIFASKQCKSLDERLQKAEAALLALTPPIGRGKRQITQQTDLESRVPPCFSDVRIKWWVCRAC